jgi:hypothetical protein
LKQTLTAFYLESGNTGEPEETIISAIPTYQEMETAEDELFNREEGVTETVEAVNLIHPSLSVQAESGRVQYHPVDVRSVPAEPQPPTLLKQVFYTGGVPVPPEHFKRPKQGREPLLLICECFQHVSREYQHEGRKYYK